VPLDYAFADRQTNAGAGVFLAAVESLKDGEDPLEILVLNADAVVTERKYLAGISRLGADLNIRRDLFFF
jgi:hypothetical protein